MQTVHIVVSCFRLLGAHATGCCVLQQMQMWTQTRRGVRTRRLASARVLQSAALQKTSGSSR